jgi:hypothetical protein
MKSSDRVSGPKPAKENITSYPHQVFHPPFAEKRHEISLFGNFVIDQAILLADQR